MNPLHQAEQLLRFEPTNAEHATQMAIGFALLAIAQELATYNERLDRETELTALLDIHAELKLLNQIVTDK